MATKTLIVSQSPAVWIKAGYEENISETDPITTTDSNEMILLDDTEVDIPGKIESIKSKYGSAYASLYSGNPSTPPPPPF